MLDKKANTKLLRFAVTIEGATLLILILIAVPLKRIFDVPLATQIMGPLHGIVFLFLIYAVIEAVAAQAIGKRASVRLIFGAIIPFGGIFNERWLARYNIEVKQNV